MINKIIRKGVSLIKRVVGENTYSKYQLIKVSYYHKQALNRIRKKDVINVCFFLIHESVWKYEELYQLFKKDKRFNPIVLVCPYVMYGEENMLNDMENAYSSFQSKGYNVLKALKDDGTWLDVKKELQPDLIFFTNPHDLTKSEYNIRNFKNYLTCYVPYNFGNSHMLNLFHNQEFHNLIWKLFAESEIHKKYSIDVAKNKGINVEVSGFPGTDKFLKNNSDTNLESDWKHKHTKKIIWAPHHTIDDDKSFVSFSSFLIYHQFMIDLLDKFIDKIEIVFKPHPLLKIKLYEHPDWGKQKTDEYYNIWKNHAYGGLNEGDYINLFLTSDTMIHDSGSFLIEYLYTEKPVLRTDRDETICDRLNSFGIMAYNVHYIAKNENEVVDYISEVIFLENDTKKEERLEFKKYNLLPPNNCLASENIYNYIVKTIS